jgi:hypothetical protein
VHLLFIADSDNARQTVPIDEVVSGLEMAMLPGDQPSTVGQATGQAFAHPAQARVEPASTVRDQTKPVVTLRVFKRRRAVLLRWQGRDTGGSGLRFYTVQARRPHGRWQTVLRATRRHNLRFRTRGPGRYAFRVSAVDGGGNRSRWSLRRASF